MSTINGDNYVFTQNTTTSNEPDFSDVNKDSIVEEFGDYIHSDDPNDYEIHTNETINSRTETTVDNEGVVHTSTVWDDHKQIEIINHPTSNESDSSVTGFEADNDCPTPNQPLQRGTIWEIHQKTISNILNQIAQSELYVLNNLHYEKRHVCLGHKVYDDCEIKGKNQRRRIQELSEKVLKKYNSDSENYKECVTSCTGIDDDNPKVRFAAVAYHVNDHRKCDYFEIQFFPILNEGETTYTPIGQGDMVKKCLGHVEHLCSFPDNTRALAALREFSHQKLEHFKSHGDYKNESQGYLKTHTFKRQGPPYPQNDLFIFFQHKDDHENCGRCCHVPQTSLQSEEPAYIEEYKKETDQNSLLYRMKDALWSSLKMFSKYMHPDPSHVLTLTARQQVDRFWSETKVEIIDGRGTPEALAQLKEFMIEDPKLAAMAHFEKSIVDCKPIVVGQKEFENCRVFGVNGMNTSEESAQEQALAMSDALNGHNVHWIYNASQSKLQDAAESRRNINNIATEASYLLLDKVTEYLNNSSPESIAYIQCHSQGTAMVKTLF